MANILVIDEKASDREYLTNILKHQGHEPRAASGGAEALDLAKSSRPDLIVADALMSVMGGFELVRRFRAEPATAATPVIFSALHDRELEAFEQAIACGVSRVIAKRADPQAVLAAVQRALSEQTQEAGDPCDRFREMVDLSIHFANEADPQRLLEGFVHSIRRIVAARYALAGLLDAQAAHFRFWAISGVNSFLAEGANPWLPGVEALETMLREGNCVRTGKLVGRPYFQSWLGTPIAAHGRIHGFVALIGKTGEREFSEDDERLAQALAAQMGRIYRSGVFFSEAAAQTIGVEREIAARTETERRLAEREEHIRLLLDSTAEAIYGLDMNGRCTFANAACARMLGYGNANELIGREMHALMHAANNEGVRHGSEESPILAAIQRNQRMHLENELFWRADGSCFPAECWSHPVLQAGQVVGAVVTFVDITERRELEKQYLRAQQRLREVVVSSPAVLFTLSVNADRIGRITWVSGNLPAVLGYSKEAALEPGWWLANVHPEDQRVIEAESDRELFARGHYAGESRFRHADGGYRWIRSDIRLIRDDAGRPVEAVGAWTDITQGKQSEAEHLKLRDQLLQAQKLESVGRLAGGVAHDFNNLLTVINGYNDLLMKELPAKGPLREMAAEIGLAGQRAAELTRQLLLLSRKQVSQTSEVNLNDVVGEVSKMLARVIGEDIRLEARLSPVLGIVMTDAWQMHQVLMNLAVNARDAMPEGGTLLIETRNIELDAAVCDADSSAQPSSYVELKVTDTGLGMSEETMSHLFEPFFTTKKAGEGTGLGLATIYGIVKGAGGSIWVDSEPGKGSTFKIYLPRVVPRSHEPRIETPSTTPLLGTETVLIVEDQEQLLRMTGDVLRGYGYTVLQASTPDEALKRAGGYAGEIHLLLTDVVMPRMRGIELARCLKIRRPAIRTVFMSGYGERFVEPREPAGHYLMKPFSPEALGRKIREALAAAKSTGAILILDEDAGIRKLLRSLLSSAGYQTVEAASGQDALLVAQAAEVDLIIADLADQEEVEIMAALRRLRPGVKMIAMSGRFADPAPRAAEYPGAQAFIAKPVKPDDLVPFVARVLAG